MQDGIFNGGNRMERTGYISHKHIYYYLHIYRQGSHARMDRQSKEKQHDRLRARMYMHLDRVYLIDTAPQHALKNKGKDPLTDKGVDRVRGPL